MTEQARDRLGSGAWQKRMATGRFVGRGALRSVSAYRQGDAGGPAVAFDLSNNELGLPPLPGVLAVLRDGLADAGRYPDPTARALTEEVATHLGLPAADVAVGPGSAGVLQQILLALCGEGDEVVHAWPAFDAYPLLVAVAGAVSVPVPLTPVGDHDLPAIRERVGPRTQVVILCSPHNPTGLAVDDEALRSFLASLPGHVTVVLDQAYAEFEWGADPSGPPAVLREHGNVVCLRTFSKAYGLAGLRVGYAAGPADVMTTVRKAALPFGVSRLAERAAICSLRDGAALRRRLAVVATARRELTDGLRELDLPVLDSRANFVWLPLGRRASAVERAAAAAGVKVRAWPRIGVRVTVGSADAHRTLLDALARDARQRRGRAA